MQNLSEEATFNNLQRQRNQTRRKKVTVTITSVLLALSAILIVAGVTMIKTGLVSPASASTTPIATKPAALATSAPTATPTRVFDPGVGAILPSHRVIAFYAVPGAEPTGPAYQLSDTMLNQLTQQGAEYQKLDPSHPVQLGIDLVVSVPDGYPGPTGYYSHHVDAGTIQSYIDYCQTHNLLLFLDLNFGQAPVMPEVNFFLPYLEKYTFVHMAVDPEWMFPRHDGIPGTNLSNVRASDLNPIIQAVGDIPMKYHVPRKILIIHEYRPSGDYTANPTDAGQAEIADKRNLLSDTRVDVVIHVDSVGGYVGDIADKTQQYTQWVQEDMIRYANFRYGGFKLFYHIEAKTRLMTPQEVLALNPAPLVVTYGN
jgi:hypothetical protein